jgi:hypothetical protein
MFDIAFTTDTSERQNLDGVEWDGLRGRTTLCAYTEEFVAPLGRWGRPDYERQWVEAANRLLGPAARAGFFTTAFQFWWVMWREGEAIFLHEEFLTPDRLTRVSDYRAAPYHLIEDRRTHNDEGTRISEWQLTVADIRGFLERGSNGAKPQGK